MNKRISLITGTSAGILYAALLFGTWSSGVQALATFMTWYTYLPVIFLIIAGGAWWLRNRSDRPFDFKAGLQYALLAYLVYELIYAASNYSLFALIDKEANNELVQQLLDASLKKMENKGASKEQMDAAAKMAESARGPLRLGQLLIGFGQNMILNFLKSVFIATITKQNASRSA